MLLFSGRIFFLRKKHALSMMEIRQIPGEKYFNENGRNNEDYDADTSAGC